MEDSFLCPVGMVVMEDPVSTVDGQTYERRAIQDWFDSGHVTSPLTGLRLESLVLTPNFALRRAIDSWAEEQQQARGGFRTIDAGQLRLDVLGSRDPASITQQERDACPLFADVEGQVPREQVQRAELGVGQDKSAYRGFWGGRSVALLLMRSGRCETEAEQFTQLGRHPHLITFFGLAELPSGKQCLVVELAPMGSLDNVVEARAEQLRGMAGLARSKMLLEAISQVCSGMTSVSSAGILHRDLALRNVMCTSFDPETGVVLVKVSDFGMSREGACYYGGDLAVPVRWTAPEALRNRRKYSEKSDIWSLGVVIWELLGLAQDMPYWQQPNDTVLTQEVVEGKRMLEAPEGADELLWAVARDHCMLRDPEQRPTFAALQLLLREKALELHRREWEAEAEGRFHALAEEEAARILRAREEAAAAAAAEEEERKRQEEAAIQLQQQRRRQELEEGVADSAVEGERRGQDLAKRDEHGEAGADAPEDGKGKQEPEEAASDCATKGERRSQDLEERDEQEEAGADVSPEDERRMRELEEAAADAAVEGERRILDLEEGNKKEEAAPEDERKKRKPQDAAADAAVEGGGERQDVEGGDQGEPPALARGAEVSSEEERGKAGAAPAEEEQERSIRSLLAARILQARKEAEAAAAAAEEERIKREFAAVDAAVDSAKVERRRQAAAVAASVAAAEAEEERRRREEIAAEAATEEGRMRQEAEHRRQEAERRRQEAERRRQETECRRQGTERKRQEAERKLLDRQAFERGKALEEARSKGLFVREINEIREHKVHIQELEVMRKYTPLMLAAHTGALEDVLLMTSAGADVMRRDPDGRNCLWVAAQNGQLDVVKHLVEKGGRELMLLTKMGGASCLHAAAVNGHLEIVKHLVEKGGRELLMLADHEGRSCLYMAAWNGRLEIVKHLAEKGGSELLMLTDEDGWSCLIVAALHGDLEVVKFLVEKGKRELLMLSSEEFSCLFVAAHQGQLEVVKYLVEKGGRELLALSNKASGFIAAREGHLDVCVYLARMEGMELAARLADFGRTARARISALGEGCLGIGV